MQFSSPQLSAFLLKPALVLAALFAFSLTSRPAHAQDAVNASAAPSAAHTWFGPDAGWDYTPAATYSLSGIETKFASGSPSQLVTVEIYSGEPASGGTLLRSATFLPSGGVFSGASFAPLLLNAGQQYFVGFRNIANLGVNVTTDPGATALSATHYDYDFSNHGTYSSVEAGDFTNYPILKFDGASPFVVLNTGDGGGAGTLRSALAATGASSDAHDTITFAPGLSGTITLGGTELAIGKSVTITGPGANTLTIDAAHASRVFNITGGAVVISGLTLTNGDSTNAPGGSSGGTIVNAGTLTVNNCVFENGNANYGGGIFNAPTGALTVTGSTFANNFAFLQGGALFNDGAAASVTDSTFSGNYSQYGGALYNLSGGLTVTNSTFSGNVSTPNGGGGIYVRSQSPLTVTGSLFVGSMGGDIASYYNGVISGGSNLLGDAHPSGPYLPGRHDLYGVSAATANIGPLTDNGGPTPTCAVLPGSPALGGDYALATSTDQRGVPRTAPQHTIGAFEYDNFHTHLLWNNADGRVMLWSVDGTGGVTLNGFGPYTDDSVGNNPSVNKWSATAVATGPDGLSHILWNNTDGRVMLWTVDDQGNFTLAGYGPYTDDSVGSDPSVNRWHATAVSVGPDSIVHLLWNNTDHRVMLWNVAPDFSFTLAGYGPYTDNSVSNDPGNLWSATALATGPDNVSRIAWNNVDGRVMLWDVNPDFSFTLAGYGPYTDGAAQNKWSATGVSVGPDDLTHLLWGNTDRRAMFWDVNPDFSFTLAGYGPYSDNGFGNLWSATALATGPDDLSRILWNNTDHRVMLWDVDNAGDFGSAGNFGVTFYGPYTDTSVSNDPGNLWSATAVSAGP